MLPKSIRIQLRFIIMSYKLIYQYPSIILGGFLEATVTILSFFIFWIIILLALTTAPQLLQITASLSGASLTESPQKVQLPKM